MEKDVVAILRAEEISDAEKVALCKEAVDARTRRGWFLDQYLER